MKSPISSRSTSACGVNCAHSLPAFFGHLGVLSFKTVEDLGGGLRFTRTPTLFDFARLPAAWSLTALLFFFQESQPVTNDLACGRVTATFHLFLDEGLEVV